MNKIKSSKKGFTLVELVVVIAILAILAAIAIPVIASTVKSSQITSSETNAQTIEIALKEARAALSSGDDSVFSGASSGNVTVANVASTKKIAEAIDKVYIINGDQYKCHWDKSDNKVYYICGTKDITGGTHTGANLVTLKSNSTLRVDTWTSTP